MRAIHPKHRPMERTMAPSSFCGSAARSYGIYVNHQAALERILARIDVIPVVKYGHWCCFPSCVRGVLPAGPLV